MSCEELNNRSVGLQDNAVLRIRKVLIVDNKGKNEVTMAIMFQIKLIVAD